MPDADLHAPRKCSPSITAARMLAVLVAGAFILAVCLRLSSLDQLHIHPLPVLTSIGPPGSSGTTGSPVIGPPPPSAEAQGTQMAQPNSSLPTVPLWNASGPPPRWAAVQWAHSPPLGPRELSRSFSAPGSNGAWCPWTRTAAALDAGEHVDIAVIGGSLTKGVKSGCPACAWASHLAPWLARARPHWNVTVTNLGEGGYGALEWVRRDDPFLTRSRADVILVDTSVNAFFHADATLRVNMDRLLWRLLHSSGEHAGGAPPAILYVCEFRLGCPDGGVPLPGPSLAGGAPVACWKPRFWEMGGVEARIAQHYGLPVASYRDAVWPVRDAPPADLPALWSSADGIHPDRVAHELIADVVKHALGRLLFAQPHSDPPLAATSPTCDVKGLVNALIPATTLALARGSCDGAARVDTVSTADPGPFERGALGFGGPWSFGNDAGRAPGWSGALSADAPVGSTWISFPVSFATSGYGNPILPHIELTFLRSYVGFISATVSLNASGCRTLTPAVAHGQLLGSWVRRVTTPFTLTLGALDVRASEKEDGFDELALHRRCEIAAHVPYALTITLLHHHHDGGGSGAIGGRFKLLGIRTCNLYVR